MNRFEGLWIIISNLEVGSDFPKFLSHPWWSIAIIRQFSTSIIFAYSCTSSSHLSVLSPFLFLTGTPDFNVFFGRATYFSVFLSFLFPTLAALICFFAIFLHSFFLRVHTMSMFLLLDFGYNISLNVLMISFLSLSSLELSAFSTSVAVTVVFFVLLFHHTVSHQYIVFCKFVNSAKLLYFTNKGTNFIITIYCVSEITVKFTFICVFVI